MHGVCVVNVVSDVSVIRGVNVVEFDEVVNVANGVKGCQWCQQCCGWRCCSSPLLWVLVCTGLLLWLGGRARLWGCVCCLTVEGVVRGVVVFMLLLMGLFVVCFVYVIVVGFDDGLSRLCCYGVQGGCCVR